MVRLKKSPDAEKAMAEIAAEAKSMIGTPFVEIKSPSILEVRPLLGRLYTLVNKLPSPVQDEASQVLREIIAIVK